jgi:hypothetical protein
VVFVMLNVLPVRSIPSPPGKTLHQKIAPK